MQLIEDLKLSGMRPSCVVLVRHAHRGELPPDKGQRAVPITAEGEAAARALGAGMPAGTRLLLSHTGTARTSRTAECIADGHASAGGASGPPFAIRAEQGSYVHSDRIYQLGWQHGFVEDWLASRIDPKVIDPPHLAARRIVGMLTDVKQSNCPSPADGELYVHVGHDWDILAVQYVALGFAPQAHPVGFLDGIVIELKSSRLFAWRDGVSGSVVWPPAAERDGDSGRNGQCPT